MSLYGKLGQTPYSSFWILLLCCYFRWWSPVAPVAFLSVHQPARWRQKNQCHCITTMCSALSGRVHGEWFLTTDNSQTSLTMHITVEFWRSAVFPKWDQWAFSHNFCSSRHEKISLILGQPWVAYDKPIVSWGIYCRSTGWGRGWSLTISHRAAGGDDVDLFLRNNAIPENYRAAPYIPW